MENSVDLSKAQGHPKPCKFYSEMRCRIVFLELRPPVKTCAIRVVLYEIIILLVAVTLREFAHTLTYYSILCHEIKHEGALVPSVSVHGHGNRFAIDKTYNIMDGR